MTDTGDLFTHARLHALHRILATPALNWPHTHLHVPDVFPAEFYARLRQAMPAADAYTPMSQTGKVAAGDYEMRSAFLLDDAHLAQAPAAVGDFWRRMRQEVFGPEFVNILLERHAADIRQRLEREGASWPDGIRTDMTLVRDTRSGGVKIHTSDNRNLLTFLFYLPEDDRYVRHGTTVYVPRERSMRCWGGPHHDFAGFDRVWTAPYRANSLFMFVKSDDSFHGVEPVDTPGIRRDILLFYIHRHDYR